MPNHGRNGKALRPNSDSPSYPSTRSKVELTALRRRPFSSKAGSDLDDASLENDITSDGCNGDGPSYFFSLRRTKALEHPPLRRPLQLPSPSTSLLSSPASSDLDSIAESPDDGFITSDDDVEWPGDANDPVCPHAASLVSQLSQQLISRAFVSLCFQNSFSTAHSRNLSLLEENLARVLALARRANLYHSELTEEAVLTLLWILESWDSQYESSLTAVLQRYTALLHEKEATSRALRPSLLDLQTSFLHRCDWQVRIDEDDMCSALADLRAVPEFLERCRNIEAEAILIKQLYIEDLRASAHRRAAPNRDGNHCEALEDVDLFPEYEVDENSPCNPPRSTSSWVPPAIDQRRFAEKSFITPTLLHDYPTKGVQQPLVAAAGVEGEGGRVRGSQAGGGAQQPVGKRPRTATPRKTRQTTKKQKFGWI